MKPDFRPAFDKKIILASQSPRRSQLLKEAGFDFEIKVKEIAEDYPDDLPADEVAEYLANKKGEAARSFLNSDEAIIIAADTVVILGEQLFGKPQNTEEAVQLLRQLSNNTHKVVTGICLLSNHKKHSFSSISKVTFNEITESEIHYYIDRFQPFDKAGGYAIQEWIGLCKIAKIEGLYSNIMGLPVARLYEELHSFYCSNA